MSKLAVTALVIFVFTFIVYFISSPGETPYNYFTRLSESLLSGKLYITENPSWLNELIPVKNKYYIVYPPMPSIILMPYIYLFGKYASQTLFSIMLGSVNVILVILLLKQLHLSTKTTLLVTIFFAFGTNHWYLASVGSSWFIAHITALFFLLLALIETFGKKRLLLIGLLLGASYWARTPVIVTVLFFYVYLWKKFIPLNSKNFYNFLQINLGLIFFVILDAVYNLIRFNNFSFLVPYQLIPGISNDPIFQQGFMNMVYIPRHIEAMFIKLPIIILSPPFVIPSLYSIALWFTSPAIVYSLKASKTLLTVACWTTIFIMLFTISLWGGVGFAQFGYRFAQDFMPFILILIALGIGTNPSKFAIALVILSVLVNLWGVMMINIFHLWGW